MKWRTFYKNFLIATFLQAEIIWGDKLSTRIPSLLLVASTQVLYTLLLVASTQVHFNLLLNCFSSQLFSFQVCLVKEWAGREYSKMWTIIACNYNTFILQCNMHCKSKNNYETNPTTHTMQCNAMHTIALNFADSWVPIRILKQIFSYLCTFCYIF